MRTSVVLNGRTRYRYEVDELRRCAKFEHGLSNSAIATAKEALATAKELESAADKLEAALNAPEPLVAGDIVEIVGPCATPATRCVVIAGGDTERIIRERYPRIVAGDDVIYTDGKNTYSSHAVTLRRVGDIQEVK